MTGTVSPAILGPSFDTTYGIDYGGFFGPRGASLSGDPFTVVWTGIDCNCSGSASFNPIIDAVLTINGQSFDFGSGTGPGNDFFNCCEQVQSFSNGHFFSLTTNGVGADPISGHDGVFYIHPGSDASFDTQAFLHIDSVTVPAPIVGTGLPALVLIAVVLTRKLFASRRPSSRQPAAAA